MTECEECGEDFPETELKKCPHCSSFVCNNCYDDHVAMDEPEEPEEVGVSQ